MVRALNHRQLIGTPLLFVLLLGSMRPLAPLVARADDGAPQLAEPSETDSGAPPEAKSHYERGRDHFRAGRYGEAIVELKAALAIDPKSANLLYNVAYTSELLGKLTDAIDYYERYLRALPDSAGAEREKTRLTIKRLRGRLSAKATEEPRPSKSPPPQPSSSTGRADVWFWAALGGGAALLAGGAVTGMLALKREDDSGKFVVGKDGSLDQHDALVNQANTFALSSDVLFAGGGVMLVGAALLYFLRDADTERAPATAAVEHVGLATNGKSAVLTLHGAF